ncbi:MAG: S8 family serine peptidase [Myxococcota bacterium]
MILITFALSLSACGDDDDESAESIDNEPEQEIDQTPGQSPVTPTYGVNAALYEGLQVDELVSTGLSGFGVNMCVVDSGIDADHPAFAHTVARGALVWRDFTTEASPTPIDTNGHGTHVTGILAMDGELTGGAPNVNLFIARVFLREGGASYETIGSAVDWCRDQGADVISMSLGGLSLPAITELLDEDATATEEAVERALAAGIYVVAAAGNTELARDVASPANVSGVIAVGAVQQDLETKAAFSQSGINDGTLLIAPRTDPDKKPEVVAPGVSVAAPMIDDSIYDCSGLYCELSGTSQATPFVSAILALVLEAEPDLQQENLTGTLADAIGRMKNALMDTAAPRTDQDLPHDDGLGYGLIQASELLDAF